MSESIDTLRGRCDVLQNIAGNLQVNLEQQARRIAELEQQIVIINSHRMGLERRVAACENRRDEEADCELADRVSAIERRFQGLKNFLEGMGVI